MPHRLDLAGKRFGRLVAQSYVPGASKWVCLCDCGTVTSVRVCHLNGGRISSCGCLHKEQLADRHRTHGRSATSLYRVWQGMVSRCKYPTHIGWKNYGGRGIKVCERWQKSFTDFVKDMGERPSPKYTIERINNDGDYEPSNCRWATRTEQALNKRPHGSRRSMGAATTTGRA